MPGNLCFYSGEKSQKYNAGSRSGIPEEAEGFACQET